MRCRGLILGIALSAGATPAVGQLAGTLDMGAGTYRPERAISGGIASIVPALRYQRGALELSAVGVYTDAPAGRWNFLGGTTALVRTPTFGLLQLEAIGHAEWTAHYRVRGTTLLSGGVRAYLGPGSGARAWVGRHHGQASSLGTRRPLRRSEIGGSARMGAVQLEFTLANTTVDRALLFGPGEDRTDTLSSSPEPQSPTPAADKPVERMALTDAVLSGRWRIHSVDFDVTLGRRFSRTTPHITIWGLSASRGIAPSLAVVAAAGRSGSDPVTSVPGARYFALGLRLQVGSQGLMSLPAPTAPSITAPFRIGPAVGGDREILIQAANARGVELAADFTDWKPVSLRRWGDHGWRVVLPISPGLHRLAVRIDGGHWQAPPGTRPISSEFGGQVAEVVVE